MRTVGQFVHRARRFLTPETMIAAVWLIILPVLEYAGRGFATDASDGMALAVVSAWGVVTFLNCRRNPETIARIRQRFGTLRKWASSHSVEWGVDLSGTPAMPRAIPATWRSAALVLFVVTVLAVVVSPMFPSGARAFLATRFYLGYLTLLGGFWVSLALSVIIDLFVTWAGLHDWFVEHHRAQGPRKIRAEVVATFALLAGILISAAFVPLGVALGFQATFLLVSSAALAVSSSGLEILWKYRRGTPVRSFDGRWLLWLQCVVSVLISASLILLAGGESLFVNPVAVTTTAAPVTFLIGRVHGWASVAGNFILVWMAVHHAISGIRFRAARLHAEITANVAAGHISAEAHRRWEIGCRRELIRRLQTLFRRAARQKGVRGTGIWVAPQHWFILGMTRDNEGDDSLDRETTIWDRIIGPPYHRVFSNRSRTHFWHVTKSLHVDLIFVENGLSFRRLAKVLRMMFEIYDIYGGNRRAEELHFTGLPGVRVVIHEIDMTRSTAHDESGYPEPDYKEVGRARILHVFKDRGETEEENFVPMDFERMPVLSGA